MAKRKTTEQFIAEAKTTIKNLGGSLRGIIFYNQFKNYLTVAKTLLLCKPSLTKPQRKYPSET